VYEEDEVDQEEDDEEEPPDLPPVDEGKDPPDREDPLDEELWKDEDEEEDAIL